MLHVKSFVSETPNKQGLQLQVTEFVKMECIKNGLQSETDYTGVGLNRCYCITKGLRRYAADHSPARLDAANETYFSF